MEFVVLILLVIALLVYALNNRRVDRRNSHIDRSSPQQLRSRRTEDQEMRRSALGATQSFDAETARPPSEKQVLCGTVYVVDGDTLTIQKTQIRLFGVDAPEMDHPYGKKAKWALVSLCKGQIIRAEVVQQDAHGRTVAKCYLQDGRDLSAEMVKIGMAIDWPKYSGGAYKELELPDSRRKMWLADARQKGRIHVWEKYDESKKLRDNSK